MSWLAKHVHGVAHALANLVRNAPAKLGQFASLLTALETVVEVAESLAGSPSNGDDSRNPRSVPAAPAIGPQGSPPPKAARNPADGRDSEEAAQTIYVDGQTPFRP